MSVAKLYKSCSVGFCAHGVTCLSMIFCLDSLYTAQNENFSMVGLGSFCQNKQDDIFFQTVNGVGGVQNTKCHGSPIAGCGV